VPTLFVENIPAVLYTALQNRARQHRRSIAEEVLSLLEENVPTADELKRRRQYLQRVLRLRSRKHERAGQFPSTEHMQREDRAR
jgi:DNA polymerase sigma